MGGQSSEALLSKERSQLKLGLREGLSEAAHLSHRYGKDIGAWEGHFGKGDSTHKGKVGIKGHCQMFQSFLLFSDCNQGWIEKGEAARRLGWGRGL